MNAPVRTNYPRSATIEPCQIDANWAAFDLAAVCQRCIRHGDDLGIVAAFDELEQAMKLARQCAEAHRKAAGF